MQSPFKLWFSADHFGHLIPAAKRLKNHNNGIPVSQNSIGLFEQILLDSLCNLNKA
jgi:hypothetical protein